MNKLKYPFLIFLFSVLTACNNYLDVVPDMIATIEDNAFSMRSQAEKFFFMCYSYIPNAGSYNDDPALLGGDEIWVSTQYSDANNAKNLALGGQRSNSPLFDFWRGINGGKHLYRVSVIATFSLQTSIEYPILPKKNAIVGKPRWK